MVDQTTPKPFTGEIAADGRTWQVSFTAKIDGAAALALDVSPLPYTQETAVLHGLISKKEKTVQYFCMVAVAKDGERLESSSLYFTHSDTLSSERETTLQLSGSCGRADTSSHGGPYAKPFVRHFLQNFEGFRSMLADCRLGIVTMGGSTPVDESKPFSGHLHIVGPSDLADQAAWRLEADKLLLHVRRVMSFAGARPIKAPVIEAGIEATFRQEIWSESTGGMTGHPVVHYLDQDAMFKAAIASYFDAPIKAKNLFFAMEWFAMPASYTEMRLVHAMTALENLVDYNLADEEKFYLPDARFNKLSKAMRAGLAGKIQADGEAAFRQALSAKMMDLNRKPIFEKTQILINRWGVPMAGLSLDDFGDAISARNRIIHRGHYYDDETARSQTRNLWDYVLTVRELVARMILTTLGYRGSYLSFLKGQTSGIFPPEGLAPPQAS